MMLEPIDESGLSATGNPRTPLRTPERWQNMARRTNGRVAKKPVSPMSGDQRPPPPSQILSLIKEPSLANYSAVRSCLRRGDHIWMEEFLAKDGLILLLTGLEEMSLQIKKLEDVMVILENINCLREVLNSEPGIEFIVRFKYDETAVQLAKVLSSENVAVKHQVYELLAALCAYSQEGYRLVHKCLKRYQETHKFDHTLHIVTSELKSCAGDDSKGPYRAVLLGFINCLIYFSDESRRKNLLRDLRNSLFFEILLSISAETGPDLSTQVAAFLRTLEEIGYEDILRLSAEVSLRKVYADISADRSRRLTKLLGKMADRDNEERFILLEKFESLSDANGDAVRSSDEATSPKTPTVVPVTSTATSPLAFAFKPFTDSSTSPMSSPSTPAASVEKPSFPNGVAEASLTTSEIQRTASVPPPPPPPPGGKAGPPPPPPPGIPKAPPGPPGGGPPPPPPPGIHARSNTWSGADAAQKLPKENLKPVRWTKVFAPLEKQLSGPGETRSESKAGDNSFRARKTAASGCRSCRTVSHSIWRQTSKDEEVQIDTTKLKDLFVEKDLRRGSVGPIMIKTPSISHDLIDSKRSLKVNICLKKFKDVTVKNLVERIENLDVSFFEPDDLTGLMGILPIPEEVEIFKNFTGKLEDLDNAEAFFYWLVRIPSFTLHVELLHFSKECPAQAEVLTKDFAELQMACDLVLGSETFKNFLHYALHVGNVLNSGRSIGEAVAIKLEGMLKLAETASNQPKVSLLHFVVQEIQKQSETALGFVDSFGVLSKASGLQFDALQSDCNALLARYDELGKRLDGASEMFQQRVHSCLKDPKTVVNRLKACRESLLASIMLVAEYFVEDPVQFKIEECFKSIHTFMKQITAVKKDFEKSEQEARRSPDTPLTGPRKPSVRHSGVSTLPRNFGGNRLADALADNGPPSDDLENRLLDQLTKAIRSGAPLRRVRMRS